MDWIGWWLTTPLSTCLRWNRSRRRPVPEPVLREMAAALADPASGPSRSEGMTAVVPVEPSLAADPEALVRQALGRLGSRIRSECNGERCFQRPG